MLYHQPYCGPVRLDPSANFPRGLIQAFFGRGNYESVSEKSYYICRNTPVQRPDGLEFVDSGLYQTSSPAERTNEFTLMLLVKSLGRGGSYSSLFGSSYAGNDTVPYGDFIQRDAGGDNLRFVFNADGVVTAIPAPAVSTTEFEWLIATFQSGAQTFAKGTVVYSSSDVVGVPAFQPNSQLILGQMDNLSRNPNIIVKAAFRFNRALSMSEAKRVMANPWAAALDEDETETLALLALSAPPSKQAYVLAAGTGTYAVIGTSAGLRAARRVSGSAGNYSIFGSAANLRQGHVAMAGTGAYAIAGSAAILRAGRKIAATSGGYSMAGSAVSLRAGRIVAATGGAYAIAGKAAVLRAGRIVSAVAGGYSIIGTPVGVRAARQLQAGGGNYTISGSALVFGTGRYLGAEVGSYGIGGRAVSLRAGRQLSAGSGAFVLSGAAAGVWVGRRVPAASGSYNITGSATGLVYSSAPAPGRALVALSGAFSISGNPATLAAARRLRADGANYSMAGGAATLGVGRRLQSAPGAYAILGHAAGITVARALHAPPAALALTGFIVGMSKGRAPSAVELSASRVYRSAREVRIYLGRAEQRVYRERI